LIKRRHNDQSYLLEFGFGLNQPYQTGAGFSKFINTTHVISLGNVGLNPPSQLGNVGLNPQWRCWGLQRR